jgi:hypothetical protein
LASSKSKLQKLKAADYHFRQWQKMPGSSTRQFSKFHESMYESPAWQDLTIHAREVYREMVRKFNGHNENDISYTYKEAQKLMHKNTFTKALDQLIDNGFIRIAEHNPHNSKCNIYAFHTAWHDYGTEAFNVSPREKRK